MTELALTPKSMVLRVEKSMSTSFRINATDDYTGTAELRIYTVTSTLVGTVTGTLDTGDWVFDLDNSVTATWPSYGRFIVVHTDSGGEPHAIVRGPLYAEGV